MKGSPQMSSLIEKVNFKEHGRVRSPNGLKETLKHNARMFVCEEHVMLWILPRKGKTGTK